MQNPPAGSCITLCVESIRSTLGSFSVSHHVSDLNFHRFRSTSSLRLDVHYVRCQFVSGFEPTLRPHYLLHPCLKFFLLFFLSIKPSTIIITTSSPAIYTPFLTLPSKPIAANGCHASSRKNIPTQPHLTTTSE